MTYRELAQLALLAQVTPGPEARKAALRARAEQACLAAWRKGGVTLEDVLAMQSDAMDVMTAMKGNKW